MISTNNISSGWEEYRLQKVENPFQLDYRVEVTSSLDDLEWDNFVAMTPGGHHLQTAMWANIKASFGWYPLRIKVHQNRCVAGGAQVLIRRVPLIGSMGYVVKGPLIAVDDFMLENFVMKQIQQCCKANHIQYLVVQPPDNRHDLVTRMYEWGYKNSLISFAPAPYTTLVINLDRELEDILAKMKSTTRYNIRLASRKGVYVREGGEHDIGVFYQTLVATSKRKKFKEYPLAYWEQLYETFGAGGYTKIFISEYKGDVVSSLLLVTFGDTVICKMGGWMGSHGSVHANELLHWEAIKWSKRQGYHSYDFGGIAPEAARAIQQEGGLPKGYEGTVTSYKYGFGGEVAFYPESFDNFQSPVLQWVYRNVFKKVRYRTDVNKFINRFIRS